METSGAVLIVDDKEARLFAKNLGLNITGTLGILIRGYNHGLIPDISSVISQLKEIGFYLPENTKELLK